MSEITDERLAELKDAHQHKSPFHVGYANTIDILAMITELQERRASSPAAGRDGDWAEVFDAQKSVIEFLQETLLTIKRDNQHYNFGSKLVRIVDGALNRIPALKETPNGN